MSEIELLLNQISLFELRSRPNLILDNHPNFDIHIFINA